MDGEYPLETNLAESLLLESYRETYRFFQGKKNKSYYCRNIDGKDSRIFNQ